MVDDPWPPGRRQESGTEEGNGYRTPEVVQWSDTNFERGRVFAWDNFTNPTFTWEYDPPTYIRNVIWKTDADDKEIARAVPGTESVPAEYMDVTNTSAVLIVIRGSGASDRTMRLEVEWSSGTEEGTSESGLFKLLPLGEAEDANEDQFYWSRYDNSHASGREQVTSTLASPSPSTPAFTEPTAEPSTTSSGAAGENTSSDSPEASDGDGGGGGLSTGAIAGIAVGSAIGFILIVAAFLWFCCLRRRRRRQNQEGPSADSAQLDPSTYVMNKEMSRVTDSPHTPRSAFPGGSAAHGALAQQTDETADERSYTPYGDVPPSASRQDLTRSAAGTPSGIHPSVAHLVEDGMTDDEIRRLEEEERQLDDEIERRARSRQH